MSTQAPLRAASLDEFRRQLVGLSDPGRKLDALSNESLKRETVEFVAILPELYGFDEREKLWEYIAKALHVAGQAERQDLSAWSCIVLRELKSEVWLAAVNERWAAFQQLVPTRPDEWQEAFIRYVATRLAAVVPLARTRWQEIKGLRHNNGQKGGA